MTSLIEPNPCKSCPYRKDAPLRLWHRSEFQNLLAHDAEPLGHPFACHKYRNRPEAPYCAGWILDQKRRGFPSIRLRLSMRNPELRKAIEAVTDGGHRLWSTIKSMCRANGARTPKKRPNSRTLPVVR